MPSTATAARAIPIIQRVISGFGILYAKVQAGQAAADPHIAALRCYRLLAVFTPPTHPPTEPFGAYRR
jgi:hypothetical protein